MNSAYKKEIRYTLIFSALLLICGHLGLLSVAFPGLQNHMIFGFPSQYIIPIVFGWLVLMLVVGGVLGAVFLLGTRVITPFRIAWVIAIPLGTLVELEF